MPRPATPLLTADALYRRLDRPPWRCLSSHELADLTGVSLNYVWNGVMRGTGPEPEPDNIHVRASNRRFFMPAIVLEWLSTKEGARVPAWQWSRRWLVEHHDLTPETSGYGSRRVIAGAILWIEDCASASRGRWRVRKPAYLDRLERVLVGVPEAVPR